MNRIITTLFLLTLCFTGTAQVSTMCMSGNCVNGKGKILTNSNDWQYEGEFKSGVLVGSVKVYAPNGQLTYEGGVKNYLFDGKGIRYEKDSTGKIYKFEEGDYVVGKLVNGTIYDANGNITATGQFNKDRVVIKGCQSIIYRSKTCYRYNEGLMQDADGRYHFDGKTTIHEFSDVPGTGRVISQSVYVNGKRNGEATEWDYENGVYHKVIYKDNTIPTGGTIYTIADNKVVATDVTYAADALPSGNIINRITFGNFTFDGKTYPLKSTGSARFILLKEAHAQKIADEKAGNAFANADVNKSRTGGGTSNPSSSNNSSINKTKEAYNLFLEDIGRIGRKAVSTIKATTYRNYRGSELSLKSYKEEVYNACSSFLNEYGNKVSADIRSQIGEIKADADRNFSLGLRMTYPDH